MAMLWRYPLLLLWLVWTSVAWAEVAIPELTKRVTDLTSTLTAEQQQTLEDKLAAFETRKGSQIAVLILPSTQPETIEAYSIRVAEQWKIGRKGVDDGVILLIAKDDRTMRLEVGRGLEGAIPDAIAKRVLAETIKPHFKNNDYNGGIDAGITQVIALIDGEKLPEVSNTPNSSSDDDPFTWFMIIMFFISSLVNSFFSQVLSNLWSTLVSIVIIAICSFFIGSFFALSPAGSIFGGLMLYFILRIFYLFGSMSNGGGGSWSGGSSSSGWSSSDSSWSGGGGDFGGGGASDSW